MRIAILGAGNVGGTLGRKLAHAGHHIFFGVPNPADGKTQNIVRELGDRAQAGTVAEAAAFGETIILAAPWPAIESALQAAGEHLRGKVLIDATNPLTPDFTQLDRGFTTSGAEQVAEWAPGTAVFKALNQTGWNNMAEPQYGEHTAVMFVCGDNEERKPEVLRIVADVGFAAIDAGKLTVARLLEPLAMLWIHLTYAQSQGRDFAFTILRR